MTKQRDSLRCHRTTSPRSTPFSEGKRESVARREGPAVSLLRPGRRTLQLSTGSGHGDF